MTPIEKAKEALSDCVEMYVLADGIQQFEEFENGQPSMGTCKNLKNIKEAAMKARDALAALEADKPAEDYDISECTSDIQSVIYDELVAYDEVKRLVKIYAESYHSKKCAECKATEGMA